MKSQTMKSQYATSIELYPFRTEAGNIDLFYKVEVLLTVEDGISLNPGRRNIVVNTPQLRDASQAAALHDAVAIATRIVVAWEAEGQFSDLDLEPVTAEDRAAWKAEREAALAARGHAPRSR